jgi:DNA-directed RNA polymerase specialized sigma24 family protein
MTIRGQNGETPESILIRHEEDTMIHALIQEPPHLFGEVLMLRDVDDMPGHEIADIVGKPAGTREMLP